MVQQIAPGLDRGLGFLNVFEEGEFAVIAAPAPGLEQFGEIFQPLLGKVAPARDNIAATRHICMKCHKSARKEKNGRGRNRHESIRCDMDILWKTSALSSARHYGSRFNRRTPRKYGVIRAIHRQAARRHGRVAERVRSFRRTSAQEYRHGCFGKAPAARRLCAHRRPAAAMAQNVPEKKDPPGGTTGRVKPYGRLGWMGARAEYSRWGGN